MAYSEPFQSALKKCLNYFLQKSSILNLWEGSEYATGSKHARVLNIRKFYLIQQGFVIWVGIQLWNGSEYSMIASMSGFIWQGYEYARVTQSAEYAWISLNIH